jgi:hypothetical protein
LKAVVELHAHVVDIAATGAARPAAHADEPYDGHRCVPEVAA